MKYLFLGIFFLATCLLHAQRAYVRNGELSIGEQTELVYEFPVDEQKPNVQFETFSKIIPCIKRKGNSILNSGEEVELELLSEKQEKVIKNASSYMWRASYRITAWDTGQIMIPSVAIQYNDSTFRFDPILMQINAPKTVEGKDIYDIKETFVDVDFDYLSFFKTYWWIFALVILVLFSLFWFIRNGNEKTKKPIKTLSLKEKTIRAIDGLEKAALWEKEDYKGHYVELSFIIRSYLSGRYQLSFLEKTSTETALLLKELGLNTDTIQTIKLVLDYADMAKFAKAKPSVGEIVKNLTQIRQIVAETSPFEHERTND